MIGTSAFRSVVVSWLMTAMLGAQSPPAYNNPYLEVPAHYRESLKETVDQMIDLETHRRWTEVYDLLPKADQVGSREDFARQSSKLSRLISFVPREVTLGPTDPNEWLVVGCGVFIRRGKAKPLQSVIYARLADSKWSVSTVLIIVAEVGPPRACNPNVPAKAKQVTELLQYDGRWKCGPLGPR